MSKSPDTTLSVQMGTSCVTTVTENSMWQTAGDSKKPHCFHSWSGFVKGFYLTRVKDKSTTNKLVLYYSMTSPWRVLPYLLINFNFIPSYFRTPKAGAFCVGGWTADLAVTEQTEQRSIVQQLSIVCSAAPVTDFRVRKCTTINKCHCDSLSLTMTIVRSCMGEYVGRATGMEHYLETLFGRI